MRYSARFLFLTIFLVVIVGAVPALQANAEVAAQSYSAGLAKSFNPSTIGRMEKTRLSVTITNPNNFALADAAWTDNLVGVQPGLTVADPANIVNNCGGTVTADPGATTISLSGGSVPANGTCTVSVDLVTSVSGNLTNTIPAGGLTATENGGPGTVTSAAEASAILNVADFDFPAEINKQFSPISIAPGDISRLSVSIFNSNTFQLENAAWSDNLEGIQPGLRIANPPNVTTTCVDLVATPGAVTAAAGGTTLALTGGTVPAQVLSTPGQCTVSVDVTSTTPGNLINTIPAGALTSTGQSGAVTVGNTSPSSATLQVDTVVAPSVTKAFSPNTIWVGQSSQLTISIKNNDLTHVLTELSLTDTLNDPAPNNVVIAAAPSASLTNCGAGAVLTAVSGQNSLTLSGASITADATCQIQVNVTSLTQGAYSNTIPAGAVTNKQGVTNASPASAPLNVQATGILKAFSPTTIQAGELSTLTITLRNPTASAYTGAALDDIMPGTMLSVVPGSAATTCGTGTATEATTNRTNDTLRLTGGVIPAGSITTPGSCTITASITTPDTALTQTHTNTINSGDLTTDQLISNLLPVSANLGVQRLSIGVVKGFSPNTIQQGGTSTATITFQNKTSNPLTIISFTDALPNGLVPLTPETAATTCAGGSAASTVSPAEVTLTGGVIPPGTVAIPGTCRVTVQVTTTGSTFPAAFTNTVSPNTITTVEGATNLDTASTTLNVYATDQGLTGSKNFNPTSVLAGTSSRLTIIITAPADESLTNFSVTDTLPANLVISNSTAASLSGCGAGTLTAVTGAGTISLNGASIAAGASCTIGVSVKSDVSGVYDNVITPAQITNTQNQTLTSNISSSLTVSHMTMSKAFYPATVSPGGKSTLTITLSNTNTVPVTGVSLTDSLSTMGGTDITVAAGPVKSSTCGSMDDVTAAPGGQNISLANGTIPAQVGGVPGICTISVEVIASPSSAATDRTNTVSRLNVSGTLSGLGTVIRPVANATAVLKITPLTLGVVKGFDPLTVFGGSSSTLSVQLVNPNNTVVTGIAFTDTMPLGMFVANPPNLSTGTCGGTLTAVPGERTFTFSGGVLNAAKRCTLTVSTTMNVNGNRTNTITAGAVTSFNGATNAQAAQASLTNLPGASISKFFTPNSIIAGQTSLLTIRITNTGNIALSNLGFSDTLPDGISIKTTPAPINACNGALTAADGTRLIQLIGGSIPAGPGTTCDITVTVTGTAAGSYLNTIPKTSLTSAEGATNTEPAEDTLTINSNPALQLVKTLDLANSNPTTLPFVLGNTIAFRLVATNVGDVPLTTVTITDSKAVMGSCDKTAPVTLLPGEALTCSATHLVDSADDSALSYTNDASADSDQTTPVTDSVTVPIKKTDALSIKKVITSIAPYELGETLNYTITATNIGTSTLTNVLVTDPGTDVTLGTCTPNQPVPSLVPGGTLVCPASHVVTQADVDAGSFSNTASVDSAETEPVSDSVTVTVNKNPEMKVFKQVVSNGPYTTGSTITYDISAVNTGDLTLHNVTLTDSTPGVVMDACAAATLVPGAILSCPATHVVTDTDMTNGGFTNTATGDSDDTPPVTDSVTVITRTPDILLNKVGTLNTGANGRADAGDTISYAFTITNAGQVTLTDISLTDILGGITILPSPTTKIATLAPGAVDSTTFTGTYTLKQSDIDAGTFSNTATATGYPPIGSPVSSTDTDTQTGLSVPSLLLDKVITSGGTYNHAGAVIYYKYTITNNGNVALTGNSSPDGYFTITDNRINGGAAFACGTATTLAIDASITCTHSYTVTQADIDAGDTVINTANAHGKFVAQDVTSNADSATATELTPWPASVTKSLVTTEFNATGNDHTQAVVGETLTYSVVSTFPAGSTITAKVVDTLDAGLVFLALDSITVSDLDTDGIATLTDSGLTSSVMTFNAVSGVCTNCTEGTTPGSSNPLIETSGGKVTFDFGNVTNTSAGDITVTMVYRAVVLNVSGNQAGTNLNNSAVFSWSGSSAASSAANVQVVEPTLTLAKSIVGTAGKDAGDITTFSITVANGNAATDTIAYDVDFSDVIPAGLTLSGSPTLGACDAGAPTFGGTTTLTAAWTTFPVNSTCTFTFDTVLDASVLPGQTVAANTADLRWTSISGARTDLSTYTASSDERSGADGLLGGGTLNDYRAQSSTASFSVDNVQAGKSFVATSEAHTTDPDVAIGEIVRYRLALQLPEGQIPNLQFRDSLPDGLTFLEGTASFVYIGTTADAITAADYGAGPDVNAASCTNLAPGSVVTLADALLPANLPSASVNCPFPNDNNVSSSETADVDTYATGTDLSFKFGTLTNANSNAAGEFVVVEFDALVDNNPTALTTNDHGDIRSNSFQARSGATPSALGTASNAVSVTVREPSLSVAKTVLVDATQDAGDSVTYTVTITAAAAPRITAFDLDLTDVLDANLTPVSILVESTTQGAACSGGTAFSTTPAVGVTTALGAATAQATATCLDPGSVIVLKIQAAVAGTAPAGQVIPNTAQLTYTSLPGANGTGARVPGAGGADNGERIGLYTGAVLDTVDDYGSRSSASFTTSAPTFAKSRTSPVVAVDDIVQPGETINYRVVVSLKEGNTNSLIIRDTLPAGFQFVSASPLTLGTNVTATLAASPAANASGTISWTFNTPVTDASDNTADAGDQITLDYVVRVTNAAAATTVPLNSGTDAVNTAEVFYTPSTGTSTSVGTSTARIDVVKPVITATKALVPVTPTVRDAGDTIEYQVTIQNTAANTVAYDVYFNENLSDFTDYDTNLAMSCVKNPGAVPLTYEMDSNADNLTDTFASTTDTFRIAGALLEDSNPWSLAASESIVCNYRVVVLSSVQPTNSITNVMNAYFDSADGNQTGEQDLSDLNNVVTNTVSSPALVKQFMASSETATPNTTHAVIGEIIRYRLVATLIEGTQTNLQLQDALPAGLIFLDDGTAKAAFVSDGAGITSSTITTALTGCSALNVNGSDPALVSSASVTCPLPDAAVSSLQASDNDTYAPDTNVWFSFGNISNANSDANNEYIFLEFNALVANSEATNQAFNNATGALSATTRTNSATLHLGGSATATATSGNVTTTIAEPVIYNVLKTANVNVGDAGDVINYTVTFTNTSAGANANLSPAFDVRVLDTLPAYVGNPASINVSSVGSCASGINTSNSTGNTLDVRIDVVPAACAVTVTYSASILDSAPVGVTITNTAAVTYSSLPASGTLKTDTANNPTGSDTTSFAANGASGAIYGERDGSSVTTNDYSDSDPHSVTISSLPVIVKNAPAASQYAVGSLVDYPIVVTVPEGTTRNVQVIDQVPAGMQYVSYSLDAAAFTGTAAVSTVTPASPVEGDDITFNFGDVTAAGNNAADNSFTLTIRLRTLNVAANQNATVLTNSALLRYTPGIGAVTSDISGGSQNITVIEPVLTLSKSADDAAWVYGQTVQYTLDLAHAVSSSADAFDIVLTDTIPAGLTYAGGLTIPAGWTSSYSAPTLTLSCLTTTPCSMPLAATAQFTFNVTVNAPPSANLLDGNSPDAVNSAAVTWTSLSGDNNPGAATGERDGSNGAAGSPNDYATSATHNGSLVDYYSIGNRVWFDTDNNSQMNGSESGISGVTVKLYEDTGNAAGTPTGTFVDSGRSAVTNANGFYIFDYLIPGEYRVVIPASNFGGVLTGYWSSATSINGTGTISETAAADVNSVATDADDNGALSVGDIVSSTVTLGPSGLTEPTGEVAAQLQSGVLGSQGAQPDGRANMTVDFGFYKTEIGSLLFLDNDTSGHYNAGDSLIDGWTVRLFAANGLTELATGTDGILNPAGGTPNGITSTLGAYKFSGLPAGSYVVKVIAPAGVVSTVDSFDAADNADPNTTTDSNDNGLGEGTSPVASAALSMTPGQVKANIDITTTGGVTYNPTLDFGFVPLYALGNRVWFDTNDDGLITAGEAGIDGVIVELYRADVSGNPTGLALLTDTTANGGYYLFDNLFPRDYVIVIPARNFSGTGAGEGTLRGYQSSAVQVSGVGVISDSAFDPDYGPDGISGNADDAADSSDDNGLRLNSGDVISYAVTLGPSGLTEPVNESDLGAADQQGQQDDGRANMSVDFGFFRAEIGDLVFADVNLDGRYTLADDGLIDGALVRLLAVDGTTEIPVGPDGILGTADDTAGGMTTVSGVYKFSGLPAGDYVIGASGPAGSSSTRDSFNAADTTDPDVNADSNDNGKGTAQGEAFSGVLTLTPGSVGALANNTVTNATATTTDHTLDFGFITAYALGNRVWLDTDNSGAINGAEVGMDGVTVALYHADVNGKPTSAVLELDGVTPRTDTTANGGYYLFDYLAAGDYVVVIPASNFSGSGKLAGYWSTDSAMISSATVTETIVADPDGDVDSDDNGTRDTTPASALIGAVYSQAVTLGDGTAEPTLETDVDSLAAGADHQGLQPDDRANMSVDFGFYKVELGDLVYYDRNVNGTYEGGTDAALGSVSVRLYATDGSTTTQVLVGVDGLLGTADDGSAAVSSSAGGAYKFSGLPEGSYLVRVETPAGMLSTLDTTGTTLPEGNVDNDDNGVGTGNGTITSGMLVMTAGEVGTNITLTDGSGSTYDISLDFGFVDAYGLGNRVWLDTDNDSKVDTGEVGVDGVTVQLWTDPNNDDDPADGVQVGTDVTTANGGYYLFDNLLPGNYIVVLPAANFNGVGPLVGYWSTTSSMAADGTTTDGVTPDPDGGIDSDDNGIYQVGDVISKTVTLGLFGDTEPVNETDLDATGQQGLQADARANMTVDFGFFRTEIGGTVYSDGNRNGSYLASDDVTLSGAVLHLFAADGTTEIPVGSDGMLGTADDGVGGVTTSAGGAYLFSGLPVGSYVVQVTSPAGMSSAIDSFDQADNDDPDINSDHNDNGIGETGGVIASNLLTTVPGSSGAKGVNTFDNLDGSTTDTTLDFGFIPAFALGNRVWYDTNDNRAIDPGETGINGVEVKLYAADGVTQIETGADGILGTVDDGTSGVLTADNGYYLFNNLPAGEYVVVIPASNFSAVLQNYLSSGISRADDGVVNEADPPDPDAVESDVDDNGLRQLPAGDVVSDPVTLGPNPSEPTTEDDLAPAGHGQPDNQSNLTVDFGFYSITLGDLVWFDKDNNGAFDAGETGLSAVDVQLRSGDNSALIATATTNNSGTFVFHGVPRGNYILRIPAAEFNPGGSLRDFISSTGAALPFVYEPAPDADIVSADSDDNGTAVGPDGAAAGPDGTFNSSLGLGGYVESAQFGLTPDTGPSVNSGLGLTTNDRVDFGMYAFALTDLSITKLETPAKNYYVAGTVLSYTITVTNNGPSDVIDASVTDALPPQISSWTWTCALANPVTSNCSQQSSISSDFSDLVDLKQGESLTYNVSAIVAADASGVLTNLAAVTPPSGVAELDDANNSDSDVNQPASLQVTKDDGLTIVGAGTTVTYQIVVTNNGLVNLTSVSISDTLPADLTYLSAVPAPDTQNGNELEWTGRSIAAGSSLTINVQARIGDAPAGSILNTVNVEDVSTGAAAQAEDLDSTASLANENLSKQLFATDAGHTNLPEVTIGELLTYDIVLTVPPGSMTDALVLDLPQSGLAFADLISVTASDPDTDADLLVDAGLYSSVMNFDPLDGSCANCVAGTDPLSSNPYIENSGSRITFDLGTLTNSSEADLTVAIRYRAVVLDIAANRHLLQTTLNNSVSWTWNGGSLATDTEPVEISEPEMSITKEADKTVAPYGTPITFTLEIAHTDTSSADAFDVVVFDELPSGLKFVEDSFLFEGLQPTSYEYDELTTLVTVAWDEFPLNETATVQFQAVFAGPSPVLNETNVEWTSLPIDPQLGQPVRRSVFHPDSTERWYDPADLSGLDNYNSEATVEITVPRLPATGFAPGVKTSLPAQPVDLRYEAQDKVSLEIPSLGVNIPIVGVPLKGEQGWDLTWLAGNAGWLEGSAYPSHPGNSVLTAHVFGAEGTPGPFSSLNKLYWGQRVILHINGLSYIYEVRETRTAWPEDKTVFKHEDYSWLTLVTCKDYNASTGVYARRTVVRAVLVKIE